MIRRGGANGLDGARALVGALYAARVAAAPDRAVLAALLRKHLGDAALAHGWKVAAHTPLALPFTTQLQVGNRLPSSPERSERGELDKYQPIEHVMAGLGRRTCRVITCLGPLFYFWLLYYFYIVKAFWN